MVFVVLNAVIAVSVFVLAYRAADETGSQQNSPLLNAMYLLGVAASVFTAALFVAPFAPLRLVLFLGRVSFAFSALVAVHGSLYCLRFPVRGRSVPAIACAGVLDMLAVYTCFVRIDTITISEYMGVDFVSQPIFTGRLGVYFPWKWAQLFVTLYFVLLPLCALLVSLMRAENIENRISVDKILINCGGIVAAWIAALCIQAGSKVVPMFEALMPAALFILVLVLYRSAMKTDVLDRRGVLGFTVQGLLLLVLPAVAAGIVFARLLPAYHASHFRLYLYAGIACALLLVYVHQLEKVLTRAEFFRISEYARPFEDELASIDFSSETIIITKKVEYIFRRYLNVSSMNIVIDNAGELETAYTSDGQHLVLNTDNAAFDLLLNNRQTILFRSQLSEYAFEKVRADLNEVFDKAHSEAMIVLNEGRHIIGIIFLGAKASGNLYSAYDYDTLTKLYSYFFVVGYYIRNIANESVLGTVNKEVFMSAQIISSIQENMDAIRSPRIDSGYLMAAAHNIGGEFIDFIKLSEDRHIFVIGDLSGKGISASMSMVILKSIVRTYLSETKDFKKLVQRVNEFIRFNLPKGTFFAGVFGLLNYSDNTMFYINCGVPALFVYTQAYNNVIEIQGEGRVLGFVKDIMPYLKVKKVNLNPGDIVLACTDGMIDAHSLRGEQFGKARVQQAMMENASYSAQKMAQFIYDSLLQFTQKELEDDVSIMVLKCQGAAKK